MAEKDEHSVADEFVHRTTVFFRDAGQLVEVEIEQTVELFRLKTLRKRGEVHNIGEQDRELLALGGKL